MGDPGFAAPSPRAARSHAKPEDIRRDEEARRHLRIAGRELMAALNRSEPAKKHGRARPLLRFAFVFGIASLVLWLFKTRVLDPRREAQGLDAPPNSFATPPATTPATDTAPWVATEPFDEAGSEPLPRRTPFSSAETFDYMQWHTGVEFDRGDGSWYGYIAPLDGDEKRYTDTAFPERADAAVAASALLTLARGEEPLDDTETGLPRL
jgi:hypothetical protein